MANILRHNPFNIAPSMTAVKCHHYCELNNHHQMAHLTRFLLNIIFIDCVVLKQKYTNNKVNVKCQDLEY